MLQKRTSSNSSYYSKFHLHTRRTAASITMYTVPLALERALARNFTMHSAQLNHHVLKFHAQNGYQPYALRGLQIVCLICCVECRCLVIFLCCSTDPCHMSRASKRASTYLKLYSSAKLKPCYPSHSVHGAWTRDYRGYIHRIQRIGFGLSLVHTHCQTSVSGPPGCSPTRTTTKFVNAIATAVMTLMMVEATTLRFFKRDCITFNMLWSGAFV